MFVLSYFEDKLLPGADRDQQAPYKEAERAQGQGHLAEAGSGETYDLVWHVVLNRLSVHGNTLLPGAT
jgi:hypothetical protein